MKSKFFVLLIATLGLVGCSKNSAAGGTSGKVDCYSVRVTEGGSTVFTGNYSSGYASVFEYKDASGKKIYTSSHMIYQKYDGGSYITADSIIRAYPDRYTNDYVEYTYSRFVGFLLRENNYYLDLGARTIDSETKWSEYKYQNDPVTPPDGATSNNKEAFLCAKNNYYQMDYSGYDYATLRLDLTESSLERHSYTMLGQDSVITYTAKWF